MKPFIRKKGKWLHVVYFNKGSTKPIEESLHIPNTKRGLVEAKTRLDDYRDKTDRYKKNGNIKISEAFNLYKSSRTFKPGTYEIREIALRHFIQACGDKKLKDVEDVDGLKFRDYLDKKFTSSNTRGIYSSEVRAFFNDMIEAKAISFNPIIVIKRKPKPVQIIPDHDFDKILSYLRTKHWEWYFLIAFLKYTGMRKIDALSLTWDCIRFDDNIIDTESIKTEYHYQIPLTNPLKELLLKEKNKTGLIFKRHKRLNFWNRCQDKLDLERHYTIHEIRKTFISTMLQTVKIDKVAKLVGHKRVETTYTYYTKFEMQQLGKELNEVWENSGKNNGNNNGNPKLHLVNLNNNNAL